MRSILCNHSKTRVLEDFGNLTHVAPESSLFCVTRDFLKPNCLLWVLRSEKHVGTLKAVRLHAWDLLPPLCSVCCRLWKPGMSNALRDASLCVPFKPERWYHFHLLTLAVIDTHAWLPTENLAGWGRKLFLLLFCSISFEENKLCLLFSYSEKLSFSLF